MYIQLNPEQKKQLVKSVEKIEGLPDSQRWRETKNLLLKVNPKLRAIDQQFIAELNDLRRDQINDFGANKQHNIRHLMEMPRYLYDALLLLDTNLEDRVQSKEKGESKAVMRKLAATFPEYRIASKI